MSKEHRNRSIAFHLVKALNDGVSELNIPCGDVDGTLLGIQSVLSSAFTPPIRFSTNVSERSAHVVVAGVSEDGVLFRLHSGGQAFGKAPMVCSDSSSVPNVNWFDGLTKMSCDHAKPSHWFQRGPDVTVDVVNVDQEPERGEWALPYKKEQLGALLRSSRSGVLSKSCVARDDDWYPAEADRIAEYLGGFFPPFHPESQFTLERCAAADEREVLTVRFVLPDIDCNECRRVRAHPNDVGTAMFGLGVLDFWLRARPTLDPKIYDQLNARQCTKVLLGAASTVEAPQQLKFVSWSRSTSNLGKGAVVLVVNGRGDCDPVCDKLEALPLPDCTIVVVATWSGNVAQCLLELLSKRLPSINVVAVLFIDQLQDRFPCTSQTPDTVVCLDDRRLQEEARAWLDHAAPVSHACVSRGLVGTNGQYAYALEALRMCVKETNARVAAFVVAKPCCRGQCSTLLRAVAMRTVWAERHGELCGLFPESAAQAWATIKLLAMSVGRTRYLLVLDDLLDVNDQRKAVGMLNANPRASQVLTLVVRSGTFAKFTVSPYVSYENLDAVQRAYGVANVEHVDMERLRLHIQAAKNGAASNRARHVLTLRLAGVGRELDGSLTSIKAWVKAAIDEFVASAAKTRLGGIAGDFLLIAAAVSSFGAGSPFSLPSALYGWNEMEGLCDSPLFVHWQGQVSFRHPVLAWCVLEYSSMTAKQLLSANLSFLATVNPPLQAKFVRRLLTPSGTMFTALVTAAMIGAPAHCRPDDLDRETFSSVPFTREDVRRWTHEGHPFQLDNCFERTRVQLLVLLSRLTIESSFRTKLQEKQRGAVMHEAVLLAKEASLLASKYDPSCTHLANNNLESACRAAAEGAPDSEHAHAWKSFVTQLPPGLPQGATIEQTANSAAPRTGQPSSTPSPPATGNLPLGFSWLAPPYGSQEWTERSEFE
jgi:hypothetical protein